MHDRSTESNAQLLAEVAGLQKRIDQFESARTGHDLGAESFPLALATVPCIIYRCMPDMPRTTLVINDYVEQLTGYPAGDFVGSAVRTWRSIVHDDDIQKLDREISTAVESGEPWRVDYRILHRDGSERWVYGSGVGVADDSGSIAFLEGAVLEMSETRKTERSLRESERQSRAWLEFSPACTKIVDLDFNLQYMSRAGFEALNIDNPSAYYGKPYPFEFYPASFRQKMSANLAWVKKTGEVASQEAPVVDVDGNEVWFHSTLVPVNDDNGEIDYIMVVSIDVTERNNAEEERLSLERQVQQAQKLESLGVLSGGIAHDLNNILMSILGNADLALHGLSPHAPARSNIHEIEVASRRAADLAKQMLAYSGKGRFVIEPINLNEFVEEMTHLLDVSISKKAVLKYNLPQNLPDFEGDATQIRQIIMNLITNASDAIGDRSGIIALSTGAMECDRAYLDEANEVVRTGLDDRVPEGSFVYLEVTDTGCGMGPDTIERVFDPFFTTKTTGSGLGMSAVLGIMRGHKGAIKVYSEIGKGTTFKVLFPAGELTGKRPSTPETADEGAWRGGGTVLIVDDEETILAVGKQMLEHLGFDVITALDGREAVERFKDHNQKIVGVLLDLTMPHLDGEQTFRELRRIRADVPVVLSSGYNRQDATQRFVGKRLAGFIQKPYNVTTLRNVLKDVLTGDSPDPVGN